MQTGVYRSLYDIKTYRYIIDWLTKDIDFFPDFERAGFFSDVFSMTFSGRLKDPTIALELLKILGKDTNFLVWETVLKDLETLKNIFSLLPAYGPIIRYETSLLVTVLNEIGWVENSTDISTHHLRSLLRGIVLTQAVRNRHKETVSKALEYFDIIKAGNKPPVGPDALGAIYDAGIIFGNLEDYEFVMERFKESTFAPMQQILLHALASSDTPYLQRRTLQFAISGAVRKQDVPKLLEQVATLTSVGHVSTFLFLMDNWKTFSKEFDSNSSYLNKLLQTVTRLFTSPYLISEAKRLFVFQEDPNFAVPHGAMIAVLKGLETSEQLIEWRELYGEQVTSWLQEQTLF